MGISCTLPNTFEYLLPARSLNPSGGR